MGIFVDTFALESRLGVMSTAESLTPAQRRRLAIKGQNEGSRAGKKTGPVPRAFEVGSKRAPVIDMLSLSEITKEREIVDFD